VNFGPITLRKFRSQPEERLAIVVPPFPRLITGYQPSTAWMRSGRAIGRWVSVGGKLSNIWDCPIAPLQSIYSGVRMTKRSIDPSLTTSIFNAYAKRSRNPVGLAVVFIPGFMIFIAAAKSGSPTLPWVHGPSLSKRMFKAPSPRRDQTPTLPIELLRTSSPSDVLRSKILNGLIRIRTPPLLSDSTCKGFRCALPTSTFATRIRQVLKPPREIEAHRTQRMSRYIF